MILSRQTISPKQLKPPQPDGKYVCARFLQFFAKITDDKLGVAKHALDLETSPAPSIHSQIREASSPGTLLSGWSRSPSPQLAPGTQSTNLPSSHPLPPTPAQRNKGDNERLPPSSPPPTSQLVVNETRLLTSSLRPTVSPPTHARRAVTRKIPRPPQPIPRRSPTGSARILAPNSDTSLSHSQSQSQSQSQPSKHESSQREYLSQLSQDPVTRDIVVDELVPKEPSIKDLQKEGNFLLGSPVKVILTLYQESHNHIWKVKMTRLTTKRTTISQTMIVLTIRFFLDLSVTPRTRAMMVIIRPLNHCGSGKVCSRKSALPLLAANNTQAKAKTTIQLRIIFPHL